MAEVLFVCTGNVCRSPSAALLLEKELAEAGTSRRDRPFGGHAREPISALPPSWWSRVATLGIDLSPTYPARSTPT